MLRAVKLLSIVSVVAMAAGCKVEIVLPEGGYVLSGSGEYDCRSEVTQQSLHSNHMHGSKHVSHLAGSKVAAAADGDQKTSCEIAIDDTTFDDTFTAVPYEGYEFKRWKKRDGGLFGGGKVAEVRIYTTGFEVSDLLMEILDSDNVYYLEPVFRKVSTPTGDMNCNMFSGSYERIQEIIFEGYNCTNSACHSAENAAGELDLSAGASHENLFRVPSAANLSEPMQRVYPGEQRLSFLYSKLAAGTLGDELPVGGGQAMPLASAPLTADHLEAMRLWIRNGAPQTNDVDDVATLLGCGEGTSPQANKITPPDAPPLGEGVQFTSGPWTVQPESENEVCFATYYDLEKTPGLLPESVKTACVGGVYNNYDGKCFSIKEQVLTQDPQSHHSIIDVYVGQASPLDSSWGAWQCLNGPSKGASCDPTRIGEPVALGGADCGGSRYVCGTPA
ncbi:MAG: hypothetical protein ACJASY_004186, partial [Halioglobus sp.]